MTTNQIRYTPMDAQTNGDKESGDVFFHFRNADNSVATIQLNPDLLEKFLRDLSQCIAASPNEKTKAKGQLFAIRDITAQTVNDSLITLRYETESGLTLETSIESQEATTLKEQLDKALSLVPKAPNNKSH